MKALILAAGRGERMRPLTDHTPKPLIEVRGKRLIEWHLDALARAGVREIVVNTAWLEDQFPATLGDGSRYGVRIAYSFEGRDHGGALETAGGIAKALPLLGDAFWVVSGDVFVPDFRFDAADARAFTDSGALGQLWLTDNAPHHPTGDFGIDADGLASRTATPKLTWASIGLFRAALFDDIAVGTKMALRPKLEQALDRRRLRASTYAGRWTDVGTLERLASLQASMIESDADLLTTLRTLEVELHQPAARSDARRLDALLHPAFREFGRSGRSYSRADMFAHLLDAPSHATVGADRFTLRRLAPDVALLTYRAAHRNAAGGLERHTLRTSIWQRGSDGWQMSFHQGTPTGPFESEL